MFEKDIRKQKLRRLLKEARLEAKLRQVDVAHLLSKPQSYVAKIESGERGLDLIEVLDYCAAINCDPLALVKKLSKTAY